jgi:preprotein translocase subunit YajC
MFFPEVAYAMAPPAGGDGGIGGALGSLMPLILMFVIFYFLLIRPQQKKQKQHREMLASLKKGDKVLTGGGMYGRIVEVDGDVLRVDLGNDMIVEVNRNFVSAMADRTPKDTGKGKK